MPDTAVVGVSNTQDKLSLLRLLILTPISSTKPAYQPIPRFLKILTGTATSADLTTFAGYTSHPPLHLKTKYYESNIAIWCDELPARLPPKAASKSEPDSSLSEWQTQMLSSEAREVRDVIGGIVLLLPLDGGSVSTTTTSGAAQNSHISEWVPYIEAVASLRDAVEDESARDVASLVVIQDMAASSLTQADVATTSKGFRSALLEQLEEAALSTHGIFGWDYILWATSAAKFSSPTLDEGSSHVEHDSEVLNTFGEKMGFPRIIEVLEGIDWTAGPSGSDLDSDTGNPDEAHASLDFLDDLGLTDVTDRNSAGRDGATLPVNSIRTALDMDFTDNAERDFTNEMMEVKMNLLTHQDDEETEEAFQVEQLSGLMERVVAIKEAAGAMSGSEKERFAKREVEKIMREMG